MHSNRIWWYAFHAQHTLNCRVACDGYDMMNIKYYIIAASHTKHTQCARRVESLGFVFDVSERKHSEWVEGGHMTVKNTVLWLQSNISDESRSFLCRILYWKIDIVVQKHTHVMYCISAHGKCSLYSVFHCMFAYESMIGNRPIQVRVNLTRQPHEQLKYMHTRTQIPLPYLHTWGLSNSIHHKTTQTTSRNI